MLWGVGGGGGGLLVAAAMNMHLCRDAKYNVCLSQFYHDPSAEIQMSMGCN